MTQNIEPQARLIASLAETMNDRMWASDIAERCRMIRRAVEEIERIVHSRFAGER
ncbi:hypothetical protein G6L37_03885 [Agrobacterium rubi]|nr:hypothetical protein [Agrobacterium rubi]NTF24490.1 hypothetical protein [Agrobacterium rubi]